MGRRAKIWGVLIDPDIDDDHGRLEHRVITFTEKRTRQEVESIVNKVLRYPSIVVGVRVPDFH